MENNYTEQIITLWQTTNLNQTEIAEKIGCTRSHVSWVVDKHSLKEKYSRPEKLPFNVKAIEGLTDEEIAEKFDLSLIGASNRRKKLGLSKVRPIDLTRRRNGLTQSLFGYDAGPKFTEYFLGVIDNLTNRQKTIIINFYITPKLEFLSENINNDSTRVYLTQIRKMLKLKLKDENLEQLLEQGVIV